MRKAFIIATLVLLAGPALAGPYDGLYRPDYPEYEDWDCTSVGSDGGALAIQGDIFYRLENQCRLTNPTAVSGMDAELYDVECLGEGTEFSYRLMILRLPEGVALIQDGNVFNLKSCP